MSNSAHEYEDMILGGVIIATCIFLVVYGLAMFINFQLFLPITYAWRLFFVIDYSIFAIIIAMHWFTNQTK
jgi:hypothetical protein